MVSLLKAGTHWSGSQVWTESSQYCYISSWSVSASFNLRHQFPGTVHLVGWNLTNLLYFQGRPFREGIRENSALWWGLVGASAVAFSGATDFMPELNRWLQIVEMEGSVRVIFCCVVSSSWPHDQFKVRLTAAMVVDFIGCWMLEKGCKYLFADLEPKVMVTRGRERREERRRLDKKDE